MGNEKQLTKKTYTQEGFEVVDEKEVYNMDAFRGGMDFFMQGGKSEAASVLKRLTSFKNRTISAEDLERFKNLEQPPVPDFQVKTREEIKAMGRFEKKTYKSNMEAFEKRRAAWDQTEAGITWYNMLSELTGVSREDLHPSDAIKNKELENEIKAEKLKKKSKKSDKKKSKEKATKGVTDYTTVKFEDITSLEPDELDMLIKDRTEKGDYKEIEEDPDEMDAMLAQEETAEFREKERWISKAEIIKARRMYAKGSFAQSAYIQTTINSSTMNDYYRTGRSRLAGYAKDLHTMLSKTGLSRDLVSKRAVQDVQTLAYMMGLENAGKMTRAEIKEAVQKKLNNKEPFTLHEKGFCSTSMSSKGYFAGRQMNSEDDLEHIGIEFIILNKKGTSGLNYTLNGARPNEDELLLDAGTKFKVIKACFNEGSDDDRAPVCGNKRSWKIYLVTIPGANEVHESDNLF